MADEKRVTQRIHGFCPACHQPTLVIRDESNEQLGGKPAKYVALNCEFKECPDPYAAHVMLMQATGAYQVEACECPLPRCAREHGDPYGGRCQQTPTRYILRWEDV